jgi:hypothetical protein
MSGGDAKAAGPLAWGAKVSPEFRAKLLDQAAWLGVDPSDEMACIAWESARTFRPDVKNMAGSGATGLIQFMPAVAVWFFRTAGEIRAMTPAQKDAAGLAACERLAGMTAAEQLDWVGRYFGPYRGRLHTLADLYMAILWPAAIGKPDDFVLFAKADADHPARYRQNAGLDLNHDGLCTKAEASAKVLAIKAEGLRPLNVG